MRLRQEYVQQVHQMVTPTTKSRSAIALRNARRTTSASMGSITAQLRLVYSSITAQLRLVYNSLTPLLVRLQLIRSLLTTRLHVTMCIYSSFTICLQLIYSSPFEFTVLYISFTTHVQLTHRSFTPHLLHLLQHGAKPPRLPELSPRRRNDGRDLPYPFIPLLPPSSNSPPVLHPPRSWHATRSHWMSGWVGQQGAKPKAEAKARD